MTGQRRCRVCGTGLPADAVYCHECGRRVRAGRRLRLIPFLTLAVTAVAVAAYLQSLAAASAVESWAAELGAAGFDTRVGGVYVVVDAGGLDVADFDHLLTLQRRDGMRVALVRDAQSSDPLRAEVVGQVVRSVEGVGSVVYDGSGVIVYMTEPTGYRLFRVFSMADDVDMTVIISSEKI